MPETTQTQKIPYLEWLWLQHAEGPQAHFYPLAHLILDGGPPPSSPWKNKSSLNPLFVLKDIEALYATRRPGVTAQHVALAHEALTAYAETTLSIPALVEGRFTAEETDPTTATHATRTIQTAQAEPFQDSGLVPVITTRGIATLCTFTDPSTGRNCTRQALHADVLCSIHGGKTPSPEELQAIYAAARAKLLAATESAVDATIELMTSSPNDEVRRKAAEMVMDRTGIVPGTEITIRDPSNPQDRSPTEILLERLARLSNPTPDTPQLQQLDTDEDIDTVDAELVDP